MEQRAPPRPRPPNPPTFGEIEVQLDDADPPTDPDTRLTSNSEKILLKYIIEESRSGDFKAVHNKIEFVKNSVDKLTQYVAMQTELIEQTLLTRNESRIEQLKVDAQELQRVRQQSALLEQQVIRLYRTNWITLIVAILFAIVATVLAAKRH